MQNFLARRALSLSIAGLALALAGCGGASETDTSAPAAAAAEAAGVEMGKFPAWFPQALPLPEISQIDRADYDWTMDYGLENVTGTDILFESTATPKEVFDFFMEELPKAGLVSVQGPVRYSAADGEGGLFDITAEVPEAERGKYNGFSSISFEIRPQTGSLDKDGMVYVNSEYQVYFGLPFDF